MTTAVGTLGTILTKDVAGSPQLIGQIQDVSGPDLSTDTDEYTNHDSSGGVEEFIPTIKRTGEITMPVVFNGADASHDEATGLIKHWEDKVLDDYELEYPDGSKWQFNAYVTGLSMGAPVDGHLMADVTFRPSGAPVFVGP